MKVDGFLFRVKGTAMRRTLWTLGFLAVASPALAEDPAPRFKVGDTFTQDVVVSRKSAFGVVGLNVEKWAQYSFSSALEITKVNADGSLEAAQTIKTAKLIDADVDMRTSLPAALAKTVGTKFELKVSPNGTVTEIKGLKDAVQIRTGSDEAVGSSLRMWSVLDADAWKELGGLTFFLPERPLQPSLTDPASGPWTRDIVHDWGALGSWQGKTTYTAAKKLDKLGRARIDYGHKLAYKAPAAGTDRDLPLKIIKSDFKIVGAGGAIIFNPTAQKVASAEEAFQVRGTVVASLGGIETAIELQELQTFRLAIPEPARRTAPK
jgi:hypothetical protein